MISFHPLNEDYWQKIVAALPLTLKEDTGAVVAVNDRDGSVAGAVIFEDWTVTAVSVHIWIAHRSALRAGLINEVANYAFTTCDRRKMYGSVPSNIEKAIKLNKHIGFTEIARLEEAYDHGIDYVLMELKRENCPYWAGAENGQEIHSDAA